MPDIGEDNFDWREAKDEGLIVQHTVPTVAVYPNPNGDLVIRAAEHEYDPEMFVVVARGNAVTVARAILKLAGYHLTFSEAPSVSARKAPEPKDRRPMTDAERARLYRQRKKERDDEHDGERDERDGEAESVTPMLCMTGGRP
jgi:hypothetical protein